MPAGNDTNWGRFATLGFEVAAGVALGVIVGHWFDNHYDCRPWGLLVGGLFGMAAGMYLLIRDALRMNK